MKQSAVFDPNGAKKIYHAQQHMNEVRSSPADVVFNGLLYEGTVSPLQTDRKQSVTFKTSTTYYGQNSTETKRSNPFRIDERHSIQTIRMTERHSMPRGK